MGKRSRPRKRQDDPLEADDMCTSDEEIAKRCTHLAKGLNLPQLKKAIIHGVKLHECDVCIKDVKLETPEEEITVEESTETAETGNEDKQEAGAWICLQCGHRGCGRSQQQHALAHYKTPHSSSHDLVVDSVTWMTWCYKCDDYVNTDSTRLTQAIEFIRKQSGLTGKPTKVMPNMKRSQSQCEAKEPVENGSTTSPTVKPNDKQKETVNDSLPPVKGLTNLGNTCFFNSVMQVLSQTHWLTQLLDMEVRDGIVIRLRGTESGPSCTSSCSTLSEIDNCDSGVGSLLEEEDEFPAAEPIDVVVGSGKPLTLTLASFLKDMHCPAASGNAGKRRQSLSTVTPSSLFNQVSKKSPQFRGFQQQDAHELLRHLLDGVRTEEITRRRHAIMNYFKIPTTVLKSQSNDVDPMLKKKLKVYGKESAHTFVDQLFGGQLLSTVICESCHQPYQILEPFMDLSLPVSEDKTPPGSKKKSISCLSPSTPVTVSKHQQKKERKAGRKGHKRSPTRDLSDSSGPEESSPSSGRAEEEEEAGGDVEDNNEEINDLITRMSEVEMNHEDSISQHKTESTSKKIRSEWVAKSLCTLAVRYQATNQECSVQSCLNSFTAPELLTGSNKYGCDNCTKRKAAAAVAEGSSEKTPTVYSVASKQLLIFAPPAILTLHLKRFTQNGITLRKAQKHVDFPLRLDLAPFCSAAAAGVGTVHNEQKEVIYSLYGVIEHSGRLSSGHYTAFVKARPVMAHSLTVFLQRLPMQTSDLNRLRDQLSDRLLAESTTKKSADNNSEGSWYYCSDVHVMAVSEEKVLRSQAFLLFYERII